MSKTPTVLHIITRLDPGGSATNTITSADRLRKHGFECELAYGPTADPDGNIARRLQSAGIPAHHLPHLVREVSPGADLRALASIRRLLRTRHYDLLHTHTSKAGILGRLAGHLHHVPVIHTPHGHVFYGYFGRLKTALFVHAERMAARWSERIVSLTEDETREALARGIGRAEQYCTIPSGVPLGPLLHLPPSLGSDFRREHGVDREARVIASVGRLVPIKGFDRLLDWLPRLPAQIPWHLMVAGDGECRAALESQARQRGIAARVHFLGEQKDIRPLLAAADLFALFPRNEGMGRAIVEAMAAGLPVIAANVGGIHTLLEDGRTGVLLAPEEVLDPPVRATELLTDAGRRTRMGQAAREVVHPAYDEATMIDRLAALYREVLQQEAS